MFTKIMKVMESQTIHRKKSKPPKRDKGKRIGKHKNLRGREVIGFSFIKTIGCNPLKKDIAPN